MARRQWECAAKPERLSRLRPRLGIVLGTGFHYVRSRLIVDARATYIQLPGFPRLSVSGHPGELFIARLGGTPALVLSGCAHFYEGQRMEEVTFPVRVLAAYGIRDLLLTNAAGGINPKYRPGDFMSLTDHINMMGINPLYGGPVEANSRFVDLSETYDKGSGCSNAR